MIYRIPRDDEKILYEKFTDHPLQSWAWGDFREETGVYVRRLIGFESEAPVSQLQVTFHRIPKLPFTVGYFPKGKWPDDLTLAALRDLGERENAIFIKMEPDVSTPPYQLGDLDGLSSNLVEQGCIQGRPLFTKHSFVINLSISEDELLAKMRSKTRYNIKLAEKHNVEVAIDNSPQAFEGYLDLLSQTTKRQKFFAHTKKYHQNMWKHMHNAGIAQLLQAKYQGKVLTSWILFQYKNKLYYPYGASSRENREVMASNLVMWRAIQLGRQWGCKSFDLWGSLGPNPDPKDPWYGFHNFKLGYGGDLVSFVGSFDLVIQPQLYKLFTTVDKFRWKLLRFRSRLHL